MSDQHPANTEARLRELENFALGLGHMITLLVINLLESGALKRETLLKNLQAVLDEALLDEQLVPLMEPLRELCDYLMSDDPAASLRARYPDWFRGVARGGKQPSSGAARSPDAPDAEDH